MIDKQWCVNPNYVIEGALLIEHELIDVVVYNSHNNQQARYAVGMIKPHYPVPAIRYEAVQHDEAIYLWMNIGNGYVYVTTWYRD